MTSTGQLSVAMRTGHGGARLLLLLSSIALTSQAAHIGHRPHLQLRMPVLATRSRKCHLTLTDSEERATKLPAAKTPMDNEERSAELSAEAFAAVGETAASGDEYLLHVLRKYGCGWG